MQLWGLRNRRDNHMPLFMDCHNVSGEMPPDEALAAAHAADLRVQDQYGVTFHKYWVSREAGKIYCLVEAPDAATAAKVHREAHGMVADEINEVIDGP